MPNLSLACRLVGGLRVAGLTPARRLDDGLVVVSDTLGDRLGAGPATSWTGPNIAEDDERSGADRIGGNS